MLQVTQLSGFASGGAGGVVTDGLQLHLDAGDAASYSGSGQVWSDLTANGYDFHFGTTSSAEGSDPTFNGTAGNKSGNEYMSTDGGDRFQSVSDLSSTVLRLLGREDQPFTLEVWHYYIGSTDQHIFANIAVPATGNGMEFRFSRGGSGDEVGMSYGVVPVQESTTKLTSNEWHQTAWTGQADGVVDCDYYINGASAAPTYQEASGFTSGESSFGGVTLFTRTNGGFASPSGSRLAIVRVYDRILTAAEVLRNFNADKGRFGL